MKSQKKLTTFKLIMMTVVAIDSLKNLPMNAQYGSQLIIYYLIAIVAFFIPSALITAELATTWPATGGVYIWVREAFGKGAAFLIVWIQLLMAMSWYPAILSFISATLGNLISPELAANKLYIFLMVQLLYWGAITSISKGLNLSSSISMWSAIVGVILPMLFFIALAIAWVYSGHSSQIDINPFVSTHLFSSDKLRLFITLLYSLMGMEIIAAHAGDVATPQTNFPRALMGSAIIILVTMIPASLAIAMVIAPNEISLISGVIDAFATFLHVFNLDYLKPLFIIAIAVGSFGIFLTWLLSSSRCLLMAAKDGSLPLILQHTNSQGMPIKQLLIQGIMVTSISFTFIYMPTVNNAFWLCTAAAAQFALLYYVILFMAALRLRYKFKEIKRPFQIGKHPIYLWILVLMACSTCLLAFGFGFLPPTDMNRTQVIHYELALVGLLVGGCGLGRIIYRSSQGLNYLSPQVWHDIELSDHPLLKYSIKNLLEILRFRK